MAGYLPDEATAAAFDDGWYRTGDVGWLEPEGWVHLTDRCKEMIKVSGFQVAPAEIEAVLHGHPAVIDCAVFGVPDERAGEVPVAAVQLEPGSDVTAEELERLVADTLATYKRLHHVVLVDAIPRTPSGKVLRRTLRDEWAPTSADRDGRADGRPPLARAGRAARRRRAGGRPPRRARSWPSSTTPSAPPSSTPRSTASGWRELRTATDDGRHPGPRRSRSRSWPRSSAGAWPTPPSSGRPWRPSCAAWSGAPPAADAETVVLARRPPGQPARPWTAPCRRARVALDASRRDVGAGAGRRTAGRRARIGAVALDDRRAAGRRPDPARRAVRRAGASVTPLDGQARALDADDAGAWQSLGLAVTSADLVGVMRGRARRWRPTTPASAGSTAPPSARSRRCSTCWPTPSWPWRDRAASPSTPPGPSTRCPAADALAAASAAKAYCARAARSVCETAIQVHGGIGNTWECLAHVFLRRALLSSDVLGGVGPNLDRVLAARGIGGDDGLR